MEIGNGCAGQTEQLIGIRDEPSTNKVGVVSRSGLLHTSWKSPGGLNSLGMESAGTGIDWDHFGWLQSDPAMSRLNFVDDTEFCETDGWSGLSCPESMTTL